VVLNFKVAEDRKKLHDSITQDYQDLEFYRDKRQKFIKATIPHHYNREGDSDETIIPTMYEMVETDVNTAVMNNPRVTVETEFRTLKSFARRFGLTLNKRLAEIRFSDTFRKILLDAEFMMGVAEIHNGEPFPLDFGDYGTANPGLPTICYVPFDDFFYDMKASCLSECRYMGKFFKADLEMLKRDANFDRDTLESLPVLTTAEATRDGSALTKTISSGASATGELLTPQIELMTVWCPLDGRKLVTMIKDRPEIPPIREQKWDGVDQGPYRILGLGDVPNQIMPLSPASVVEVLHRLVNSIWRKLKEQAMQQKNVTAYAGAAREDAERLRDAKNGSLIHVSHLELLKMFSTMGPDQGINQLGQAALMQFDRGANNLPLRAGLAAATDTVGQDQMLYGASSQLDAKKQNRTVSFAADCIRDLGFLLWQDKFYERQNFHEQGTIQLDYAWSPTNREGNFDQFTLRVEPYSMMYVNPSTKFRSITDYLLMRMQLMQAGDAYALAELDALAAEYLDFPRLLDICVNNTPSQMDPNNFQADMLPDTGKPNGQYTRRNVASAGSSQYQANQLQGAMLKASNQQPTGVTQL
jgi:hypothetical protein